MAAEHRAHRLDVAAVQGLLLQPLVLDLRHVDRGVPGGQERGGADGAAELVRQGVHLVAEDRAPVAAGVEVEVPRLGAQGRLGGAQDRVPVGGEGLLLRPDGADDLHARIAAVGVDADQPPAGAERPGQRRHHLLGLEGGGGAGPVGLRGHHQVEVGAGGAGAGDHRIQQEAVVLAVEHQDRRPLVDRVALPADPRLPGLGEEGLELGDLLLEVVRAVAPERRLLPDEGAGRLRGARGEPGRFRVVEVGQDQDRGRMLEQAVGHLLQGQAHVLQADLLADDVEGQGLEAGVHRPQEPRQHRPVADPGVVEAQCRRAGAQVGQLFRDAPGDHPLLATGVDEEQVFLPVVEETEIVCAVLPVWRSLDSGRLCHVFALDIQICKK